ncbi:hypothetical protein HK102_007438 [Quaeritorhiza haematococci]|nr:hypothetical protein HK102_007438 [Quaeritorhiza haematococci]
MKGGEDLDSGMEGMISGDETTYPPNSNSIYDPPQMPPQDRIDVNGLVIPTQGLGCVQGAARIDGYCLSEMSPMVTSADKEDYDDDVEGEDDDDDADRGDSEADGDEGSESEEEGDDGGGESHRALASTVGEVGLVEDGDGVEAMPAVENGDGDGDQTTPLFDTPLLRRMLDTLYRPMLPLPRRKSNPSTTPQLPSSGYFGSSSSTPAPLVFINRSRDPRMKCRREEEEEEEETRAEDGEESRDNKRRRRGE